MEVIPSWAVAVGTILGLVLPAIFTWLAKNKERKKENEKILHTAPDDPVGRADFDKRERMQSDTAKPHPE